MLELHQRRRYRKRFAARLTASLLATGFVTTGGVAVAAPRPESAAAGALNIYGEGLPNSWDPVFDSSGLDVRQLSFVYDGLTQISPTGKAEPGVASKWTVAPNGLSITFTLRPGLKFSDGTALDAEAVKVNLDRARTVTGSLVASLLTAIKSETVLSTDVIRLNLAYPDDELPLTLAGKAGMLASPKVIQSDPNSLATKPVGAGPFEMTNYVPNGYANFVRNPSYWNASNIHIKSVYMSGISSETSPQSVVAALESGQANYAVLDGPQVSAAKSAGFKISVVQNHVTGIEVSNKVKPFNNPLVVQAINYALNRKSLAESQTLGYGLPDDEPESPTYYAYSKAVANYYYYDPAKAKSLLAKAGYPGGKGLKFSIQTSSGSTSLAEAIQGELQAVGVKTTIKTYPSSEGNQLVFVEHALSFAPSGWDIREAPIDLLELLYGSNGLLNESRDAPANLTQALAKLARVSLNSPNFTTTLQDVVAMGVKENPNINLYTTPQIVAYSSKIKGFRNFIDFPEFQGVTIQQ